MRLDLELLKLINHGMKDELRKIMKELSQHKIKIEANMDDITGLQFSGTEEGLLKAQNRVKKFNRQTDNRLPYSLTSRNGLLFQKPQRWYPSH